MKLTRSGRLPRSTENRFEPKILVGLLVNFFETQCFFKADSPRFGRRDETEIANEEDAPLVDSLSLNAL